VVEEAPREAHLPAEQPTPGQAPWLPTPDVDARRSGGGEEPAAPGPSAPVGLIWRLTSRRDLDQVARRGRRTAAGPLWARVLPDPSAAGLDPPRVAFAVGRKVGNAVTRNRVRRRLRELLRHQVTSDPGSLPSGRYLIGAGPAASELSFEELGAVVEELLQRMNDRE
jgi:ribonuclease P protein component